MHARPMDRHLEQDELERFLTRLRAEGVAGPSADLRAHVDACGRCRRELRELRELDEALAGLPRHAPSPGFAEAVMARVQLPLPWYRRVWASLTERSLLAAALVAGLGASTGVTAWWIVSSPTLSVGGLATFALERASALFWSAVVALGRWLWSTGLPGTVASALDAVEPIEAVLAMGVLSLCALSAGAVMARLLGASPARVAAGR